MLEAFSQTTIQEIHYFVEALLWLLAHTTYTRINIWKHFLEGVLNEMRLGLYILRELRQEIIYGGLTLHLQHRVTSESTT
jgi:hypothetical protein